MAQNSYKRRSHRKKTDDKLDLNELTSAPNLRGMLSFLEVTPEEAKKRHELRLLVDSQGHTFQPVPKLEVVAAATALAPVVSVPTVDDRPLGADDLEAVVNDRPLGVNEAGARPSFVPTDVDPVVNRTDSAIAGDEPSEALADGSEVPVYHDGLRKGKVFRASRAQHGHTPAEQLLYLAMWTNGRQRHTKSREIQAGYRQLAGLANLNDKTVKYAVQSLVEKLALEVVAEEDKATSTGRTYCVYSYEEILARRKEAGLVWVRKNRGVTFVEAPTTADATGLRFPTRFPAKPKIDPQGSGAPRGLATTGGRGQNAPGAVGLSTTPLGSIGIDRKEPSSPTTVAEFPAELSKGLQKLLPYIDQEAVALLWTDCRARVNDCSPDEILNFVRLKGSIALNGRINNPVGFLLRAVPKCFEGRGFQEFREEQERRREAARNQDTAEKERSRQMQEEAVREETAYQQAKGKLNSLPREQYESLENRAKADVEGRFSRFVGGAPQTLRELIEQKMVELLRAEEEAKVG